MYPRRQTGRPPISSETEELVVRMATPWPRAVDAARRSSATADRAAPSKHSSPPAERCLRAVRELSQAFALAVPHEDAIRIRDDVASGQERDQEDLWRDKCAHRKHRSGSHLRLRKMTG